MHGGRPVAVIVWCQQGGGLFVVAGARFDASSCPQVAGEAFVSECCASPGWTDGGCLGGQVDGAGDGSGGTGQFGGLPQTFCPMCRCCRIAALVPQLQGTLEVANGGSRRKGLGGVGGGEQRHEGGRGVTGAVELEGQFSRAIRATQHVGRLLRQGVGDAPVQARALGGQQLLVHDLADQRVTEPVRVDVPVDDDEAGVDRRPQRRFEAGVFDVRHTPQQTVVGVAADCRNDTEHPSGRVVEVAEVAGDQVGQHRRDGFTVEVSGDELSGEEGVALTGSRTGPTSARPPNADPRTRP